ncbi:MAG: copper amine oxidase N-terminal domain-containing protein [Armatimonadetes bacterium]|nr:copper amine oxidase N-terminal domain-containing protein [Armatimonadota bacterium]
MGESKLSLRLMLAVWAIFGLLSFCYASPPGGRIYPKANEEATEKLKEAYAAYHQGWYDRAIELAMEVYRKYGDVHARWWPTWTKKLMKNNLPDPHDRGAILGATIEGKAPLTMMVTGVTTVWLLSLAYLKAGRYEELAKASWGDPMLKGIASLHLKRGDRPLKMPPKSTWRPLPLRFREEDYFILVPLDEACKVLGLGCRLDISPKTKRVRYAFIGEKGKLLPGLTQARDINGEREDLAYAPFEEDGKVWVPFYWLAKQAGIRGWEVRNGKIYVAPK